MLTAFAQVPAGTVVRLSITVPGRGAPRADGFVWTASRPMTVEEARTELTLDLVKTFMETFLPID